MRKTFKNKIKAHQEGSYDYAAELIKLAHKELCEFSYTSKTWYYEDARHYTHWTPNRELKKHKAENFIAIHIRTVMEKHAKIAYQTLRGIRRNDGIDDLDYMYSTLERAGYKLFIDDFDKIDKKVLADMESKIGYWDIVDFTTVLNELLPAIKKIKVEKKKLIEQIEPSIKDSLNEALAAVDVTRSEKEIVKFVNLLIDRKTYLKLTKSLGTKVHKKNGEKYYVTKEKMQFKKVNIDKLLRVDESKLTKKQTIFYSSLKDAVEIEIKNCNSYPFIFDETGKIVDINKRYFARLLLIKESAFKNRLIRLQKKKEVAVERRIAI